MHFSINRIAQVALGLLFSASFASSTSIQRRATVCNGFPELCTKTYGEVSFVGAHNSYAVSSTNLAASQDYDVTQQLKDGIRLLTVQAHQEKDGIHLCRTSCLLYDAGFIVDYLKKLKAWLVANPTEVVTLIIVNIDNVPALTYAQGYVAAGLTDLSYNPPKATLLSTEWPTLGEMIDSGKRLVTFLDHQADFSTVPYLIDEFTNVWETPFDVMTQDFPCPVNRTKGDPTQKMYLINHYLFEPVKIVGVTTLGPAKSKLLQTNAASGFGSLGQEVDNCKALYQKPPNFLLVDFYSYGGGSVFQVAAAINGVQYAPTSPIAPPNPAPTSTAAVSTKPLRNDAISSFMISLGQLAAMMSSVVVGIFMVL